MSGKEIYEHESALDDLEIEPAEQTAEKVSKWLLPTHLPRII
jgi:hypothetical protein